MPAGSGKKAQKHIQNSAVQGGRKQKKTGIKLQTKNEKIKEKVTPKPVKKPEKIWCVLSQKQTKLSTKSSKTLNN